MSSVIAGLRVFVVMPFGTKKDADGRDIDFNAVYRDLIQEPLVAAGADVFRADVETRPGNILADMFQELLLADLVVADVTIDNPNAWYELGVRHALRPRGTIMLQGGRARIPFDIGPERVFGYRITGGRPDPATLEEDRGHLRAAAEASRSAWHGYQDSPVFGYLPSLQAPEWRRLRVGGVRQFWERLDTWQGRVEAAIERNQPGDVLLLADEPPAWPLRFEALQSATRALVKLGRNKLAVKVAEQALALRPDDVLVRQQKAIAHGRLGQVIEARQILEALAREDSPEARASCGETQGNLGRLAKSEWRTRACSNGVWRKDALAQSHLLRAVNAYAAAFRAAPTDYFPGINAVTLGHLYRHLSGKEPPGIDLQALRHGVEWAVSCAKERWCQADPEQLYWALATEAELKVLVGDVAGAADGYATAAATARSWFELDSSRQQLQFLGELSFQPEAVAAGLELLNDALRHFERPAAGGETEPKLVVLFSGRRLADPAGESLGTTALPAAKADAVRDAIAAKLDELGAARGDLGLCGGACGGDLLFAEACLARGMRVHVLIPEDEPSFLRRAVSCAGLEWHQRFFAVVKRPREQVDYRIQPDALGPAPKGVDADERNSRWLAYTAMAHGLDRLRLLCLWDGKDGDNTARMIDLVERIAGAPPTVIDPASL